jgi:transaldolase
MKFFVDTANVKEIKEAKELGIADGVTTNPSLIAKEGRSFQDIIKDITNMIEGPVSVEAVSLESKDLVNEARELSKLADNVVVKIPMTKDGIRATRILSDEGIKTNVTLVFSANQALLAAKVGATYVSPFIGRLDDAGHDGMQVIHDTVKIFKNYDMGAEVIVASIRHPLHVIDAAKSGAQVSTIPFNVIDKMFKHPLTDSGLKKFLEDWKGVK